MLIKFIILIYKLLIFIIFYYKIIYIYLYYFLKFQKFKIQNREFKKI